MRYFSPLLGSLLLGISPAAAQDANDGKVERMLETSRKVFGVTPATERCVPSSPDEIVVCVDHGRDQRLPPDNTNTDNGIPHPPNVKMPSMHSTVGGVSGCFLQKCPKHIYYVNVSELPQAPEGSDADKIAKGDVPAP